MVKANRVLPQAQSQGTTCRHCGELIIGARADTQYHPSCRVAAWRLKQVLPPVPVWLGKAPTFETANEELAGHLLDIAENADGGEPKTVRRFYYLALSHGYIDVDMSAGAAGEASRRAGYKKVQVVLRGLRYQGRLGWDQLLDLTRDVTEWQVYTSVREARAAMRERYTEDKWIGQPYYPILLVEKDTMEPICKPLARRWQIPFASSRGYASLTLEYDVAEILLRRQHQYPTQRAMVLFISDLDPSGLDLERRWKEVLADFDVEPAWKRLALTPAQVATAALRRLSIEVKPSDTRAEKYIAQYGDRCWEVDVLPSTTIERDLNNAIYAWLDIKQWKRRADEIEAARKRL
jgi:hypothetical protein